MKEFIQIVCTAATEVAKEHNLHGFNKVAFYTVIAMLFAVVWIFVCVDRAIRKMKKFIEYMMLTQIQD